MAAAAAGCPVPMSHSAVSSHSTMAPSQHRPQHQARTTALCDTPTRTAASVTRIAAIRSRGTGQSLRFSASQGHRSAAFRPGPRGLRPVSFTNRTPNATRPGGAKRRPCGRGVTPGPSVRPSQQHAAPPPLHRPEMALCQTPAVQNARLPRCVTACRGATTMYRASDVERQTCARRASDVRQTSARRAPGKAEDLARGQDVVLRRGVRKT